MQQFRSTRNAPTSGRSRIGWKRYAKGTDPLTKAWNDLFRQYFHLLRQIEHRIEDQKPRTRRHKFFKLVRALLRAAPDRYPVRQLRHSVVVAEPFARSPQGALAVFVDTDIDSLRYGKVCRISARFNERPPQAFH